MDKFTFTVSEDEAGVQLRKIIKTKYHLSSRLMTTIKYKNLITLNGKSVPGWIVPRTHRHGGRHPRWAQPEVLDPGRLLDSAIHRN